MIRSFRDAPLRKKLVAIILLTSGIVLAGSSVVFVINEALSFRSDAQKALESTANVIGNNSVAAVMFQDRKVAAESLAGLARTIRSSPPTCSRVTTRSWPPMFPKRRPPGIFSPVSGYPPIVG